LAFRLFAPLGVRAADWSRLPQSTDSAAERLRLESVEHHLLARSRANNRSIRVAVLNAHSACYWLVWVFEGTSNIDRYRISRVGARNIVPMLQFNGKQEGESHRDD